VPMKTVEAELKTPELIIRLFEKEGDKEVEKHTLKFGRRFNKIFAARTGLDLGILMKTEDFVNINLAKPAFAKKADKGTDGPAAEKPADDKKAAGKTTG